MAQAEPAATAARPADRSRQVQPMERWPALLAMGFVAGVTCWLWRRFNAPPGETGTMFPFDLVFYYYPMLEQAADRLGRGELPLWNPWQCCGVPFLATIQVAVFYPGTWLALLMPPATAIVVSIFGHCALGGIFSTLFFRSLGNGWYAAALGGGLFVFACMLGQSFWPPEVSTICWMPFLFWVAEGYCRSGALRWWLALAAGTALQALAGFPQFVVYTWYLLGPFILIRVWHWHRNRGMTWFGMGRRLCLLAMAGLLAMGVSAAQWVPALELARCSPRDHSLSPEDVHYLEIEREIPLELKGLIGNLFDSGPKMITFDFPDGSGHLGVMAPFMVALGLMAGWKRGYTWLFVAAAGLFLVLALGYSDGSRWLYELYARLPTGSMFRTPARLLLLCWFSAIVLAVIGFDSLAKGLPELRANGERAKRAILIAVSLIVLNWLFDGRYGPKLAIVAAVLVSLAIVAHRRKWMRASLLAVVGVFVAWTLAAATEASGSLRDLPLRCASRLHYRGAAVVPTETVSRAAEVAELGRVAWPFLWPPKLAEPAERPYGVSGYEPLLPQRWSRINREMDGTSVEICSLADPGRFPAFYDLAGVTHLISVALPADVKAELDRGDWRFVESEPVPQRPEITHRIERRLTALPRAYLVEHYEVAPAEEVLKRVVAGEFDWHGSVLLEEAPGVSAAACPSPARAAEIIRYDPEKVVVRTAAEKEALLVLSDTWMPGWQATIAGEPVPILRANYLFRAVCVPAGTSEVVFEYRPAGVQRGVVISLISLVLFAILGAVAWLSRPRHGSSPETPAAVPAG